MAKCACTLGGGCGIIMSAERRMCALIRYRCGIDVMSMLNDAGWSSYRIRQERVIGERSIQKIRDRQLPSWNELDKLCSLLHCHPVDLLEYIPDAPQEPHKAIRSQSD